MNFRKHRNKIFTVLAIIVIFTSSCSSGRNSGYILSSTATVVQSEEPQATSTPASKRPVYEPGSLVDYVAQSGDSLDFLAWRFGCTPQEILWANPQIPEDVTTLPPGFPMKMPIYYKEFWGTEFQIIPDAAFVYGPDLIDFDLKAFLQSTDGWFKNYRATINDKSLDAAGVLTYYGENLSLNPKMLLALIEFQTGALSNPRQDASSEGAFLGFDNNHHGPHLQISFVAKLLNEGF